MTTNFVFVWAAPLLLVFGYICLEWAGYATPMVDLADDPYNVLFGLAAAGAVGYGVMVGAIFGPYLNGDKLAAWRRRRMGC